MMTGVERYWGYLGLGVLVILWVSIEGRPVVLFGASLLVASYFLFQVPVWCGAVNRDGTLCRRNSSGLLFGCAYRQHKWQRLKMTVVPHAWRELNKGLWVNPTTGLATIATLVTVLSSVAALIKLALT
jgi:hypothetical protein